MGSGAGHGFEKFYKRQPMAFLLVDVLEISYANIVFVRVEWR